MSPDPAPKKFPAHDGVRLVAFSISFRRRLGSILLAVAIFALLTWLVALAEHRPVELGVSNALLIGLGVGFFEEFYVQTLRGRWLRNMHPLASLFIYAGVITVMYFVATNLSHLILGRLSDLPTTYSRLPIVIPLFLGISVIGIVAMRGPGLNNTILAVSIVHIPVYARLARASTLSIKEHEYVTAARAMGARSWRILTRAILPNAAAPLVVQATLGVAGAILEAAALGYLGLGAQPPAAEWGVMLSDGYSYLLTAFWAAAAPGAAIALAVLSFNLAGDGLHDALEPRLSGS